MKLGIFVCEDDKKQLQYLKDCIQDYLADEEIQRNIKMELRMATESPIEILDYLREYGGTGLYFLDVDLGTKINGIELAREIRQFDKQGEIVFITSKSSMMPLTFKYRVKAMDYILKDEPENLEAKVIECLEMVDSQFHLAINSHSFQYESNGKIITEPYENILYFQKNKGRNKVTMFTKQGFREFTANLKDILDLDGCLFKCNHGTVVNLHNIVEFRAREREVELVGGVICETSVRLTAPLKKKLGENR